MANSKFKLTSRHIDMILAIRLIGGSVKSKVFYERDSQTCDDLLENGFIEVIENFSGNWFAVKPNFIDRNYDHFVHMMINAQ